MKPNWPTKDKDMHIAQLIMEEYAKENDTDTLGLFELVVDAEEKKMDYQLSNWVIALAEHFTSLYGANQGDYITRQVISKYITQEQTVH